MCRIAWLGSDLALPVRTCEQDAPELTMTVLPSDDVWARDLLQARFVYALGHNSGCACHFGAGGPLPWPECPNVLTADELAARQDLVNYLREVLVGNRLLLLTCWNGVTDPPPSFPREVVLDDLAKQSFSFTEEPTLTRLLLH